MPTTHIQLLISKVSYHGAPIGRHCGKASTIISTVLQYCQTLQKKVPEKDQRRVQQINSVKIWKNNNKSENEIVGINGLDIIHQSIHNKRDKHSYFLSVLLFRFTYLAS